MPPDRNRRMAADFSTLQNRHEAVVFATVQALAPRYPGLTACPDLLADVACVALNRLPPRYIRHAVDFAFFQGESEREQELQAVTQAVEFAFGFVQARTAMRARA
jgi:hypothetical protein